MDIATSFTDLLKTKTLGVKYWGNEPERANEERDYDDRLSPVPHWKWLPILSEPCWPLEFD